MFTEKVHGITVTRENAEMQSLKTICKYAMVRFWGRLMSFATDQIGLQRYEIAESGGLVMA